MADPRARSGLEILSEPLPMEGRLTFLPAMVTPERGREWAVPGVLASAWNAFTAPGRALQGQQLGPEEALSVSGLAMLGGMPVPKPTGPGILGMNVFNKFDMSKMGEVNQAYGHGRYLAKKSGMGKQVDLPDEHIARMLDWDAPLSKQPENVQLALQKLGMWGRTGGEALSTYWAKKNEVLITDYKNKYGSGPWGALPPDKEAELTALMLKNREQASQLLRDAGVPGVRYLDQQSRVKGFDASGEAVKTKGTSTPNFVVFDDSILK